jgi:hypothetical protein
MSPPSEASFGFRNGNFYGVRLSASRPTLNLEDQGTSFSLVITFDLSGKGDPVSSYATAGIALRIIWPRKPHHYVKVGITSVGRLENHPNLLAINLLDNSEERMRLRRHGFLDLPYRVSE